MSRKGTHVVERLGEAFEFDEQLTVIGTKLEPGDQAPDFTLDWINPETGMIEPVSLSDSAGDIRILSVVNSLDTPVCQVETRTWETMLGDLPAGITVYTITMDLPFAVERWTKQEGVTHKGLSSHRSEQFGRDYGVLLKEWRMLQRSVFVIDGAGKVTYCEYVDNQMMQPNYEAAVESIRRMLS
jgi:thioredoxin-dependent peroxiredoxin